ncbi:sugar ABC transporter permease [Occultella aeris]|uniref:Putative multiple-sugar transport system permease YteP n=1 Tax=Occultella aeris TaxID=2761496 RepID=A0A7M4DK77_9MICO|nr:ABC transporter permease subunit [Occultella aeris]VZO37469.1 putative multiple-sugar transport system permease YteP [Occultella aeris]
MATLPQTIASQSADRSPAHSGDAALGPGLRRRVTEGRDGRGSWRSRLRRDWVLVAMVAPGLVLLVLFQYVPLLGNVIAFQDYVPFLGFGGSEFVGLENFRTLFADDAFWNSLVNTLLITLLNLALFFPVPIVLALLLDSLFHDRVKKLVQGVMFLPHFISWVVIVALFTQLLGGAGLLNQFLLQQGMDPVQIIGNASIFKLLLVAQVIWKDAGWACIIFLAALASIDTQLYESAAVDGARYWRRLWHVTLPGIMPVIVILLILRLGDALTVGFEQVLLQRDMVGPQAGEVLDTYVYFFGVQGGNWSVAAAAGLLKAVVGLGLVLSANSLAHRFGQEGVYQRS